MIESYNVLNQIISNVLQLLGGEKQNKKQQQQNKNKNNKNNNNRPPNRNKHTERIWEHPVDSHVHQSKRCCHVNRSEVCLYT